MKLPFTRALKQHGTIATLLAQAAVGRRPFIVRARHAREKPTHCEPFAPGQHRQSCSLRVVTGGAESQLRIILLCACSFDTLVIPAQVARSSNAGVGAARAGASNRRARRPDCGPGQLPRRQLWCIRYGSRRARAKRRCVRTWAAVGAAAAAATAAAPTAAAAPSFS